MNFLLGSEVPVPGGMQVEVGQELLGIIIETLR